MNCELFLIALTLIYDNITDVCTTMRLEQWLVLENRGVEGPVTELECESLPSSFKWDVIPKNLLPRNFCIKHWQVNNKY
jgi:hypothetical protein